MKFHLKHLIRGIFWVLIILCSDVMTELKVIKFDRPVEQNRYLQLSVYSGEW